MILYEYLENIFEWCVEIEYRNIRKYWWFSYFPTNKLNWGWVFKMKLDKVEEEKWVTRTSGAKYALREDYTNGQYNLIYCRKIVQEWPGRPPDLEVISSRAKV